MEYGFLFFKDLYGSEKHRDKGNLIERNLSHMGFHRLNPEKVKDLESKFLGISNNEIFFGEFLERIRKNYYGSKEFFNSLNQLSAYDSYKVDFEEFVYQGSSEDSNIFYMVPKINYGTGFEKCPVQNAYIAEGIFDLGKLDDVQNEIFYDLLERSIQGKDGFRFFRNRS